MSDIKITYETANVNERFRPTSIESKVKVNSRFTTTCPGCSKTVPLAVYQAKDGAYSFTCVECGWPEAHGSPEGAHRDTHVTPAMPGTYGA